MYIVLYLLLSHAKENEIGIKIVLININKNSRKVINTRAECNFLSGVSNSQLNGTWCISEFLKMLKAKM